MKFDTPRYPSAKERYEEIAKQIPYGPIPAYIAGFEKPRQLTKVERIAAYLTGRNPLVSNSWNLSNRKQMWSMEPFHGFKYESRHAPNIIHRAAQRVILGFKWSFHP